MKRKALCLLLAVCMLLALVPLAPVTASALEDTEPNDTAGLAQLAPVNDTINGSIGSEGDRDFYRFDLEQSGRITFEVTSYMEYYCLYLYNNGGNEMWHSDNNQWSAAGMRNDSYTFDLAAGTYYLQINGYRVYDWDARTGNYTIKTSFIPANANETEPNDTAGTANDLAYGQEIKGQLNLTDKEDFYKFVLPEAGRVHIDMTSYMRYTMLNIYNEGGTQLWYSDNKEYNASVGYRTDAFDVYLEAGTYFIRVSGYRVYDWDASTGTYSFTMNFISGQTNNIEPNNSETEAQDIQLGRTIHGQISVNDELIITSSPWTGRRTWWSVCSPVCPITEFISTTAPPTRFGPPTTTPGTRPPRYWTPRKWPPSPLANIP